MFEAGAVHSRLFVAHGASVRGDEGRHIDGGDYGNIQEGAVINGVETFDGDHELPEKTMQAGEEHDAVSLGTCVSLTHQAQVPGPATIGDNTFVGMQALIFR